MAAASVRVDGELVGAIDRGLLLLVGIEAGDEESSIEAAAEKIAGLRIFPDSAGRTNLGLGEAGGAILVVSQFTLLAETSKGRRPSFLRAARPEIAEPLVEKLAQALERREIPIARGRFGAEMSIQALLEGPFTLVLEFPCGGGSSGNEPVRSP